ncbi:MAG: C4-dicarboxylate ABC transporter [Microbacterium sp.]|uniref:C4-dicarboxylate ABC transporter n=1 Tax=Microbacterium ginsengisoli TaxID=400772 RepID=A0A0F0M0J6_9MICO|nr:MULTISPECIES: TDT family transporter [Microbacterium]MAL07091.1 C4-dicarboxylate ABC transporter [Microbacterium sp.]KJL37166.1 C4-dicarboxylate transporter/malic acid transport protein [Microbacterium ginsengisoli]MBN9209658.1 TDT family transporter [Microbacterium ginsengisoli]ODU77757.1 MAG: C4-dicarboxylate ABC transporter [Microbacterium sp. SCN 71-21]HAN22992.1 C4-dicarboxylate ABC transporter [Microbacterium ginsengisoli]
MSHPTATAPARRRWLQAIDRPRDVVAYITPNWFASVMGTGIVANAAVALPVQVPGQRTFALVVWLLASAMFLALIVATALHWIWFGGVARGHHSNATMAHFYGAPAMAALTVGLGTLVVGVDILGEPVAVAIDAVLWTVGTVLGLIAAVTIPYLTFTRHDVREDSAFGGWLMPIVPPMVSAATGAALLPHIPAGQLRLDFLLACYAMTGMTGIAALIILTQLWGRLARHKVGAVAMVPTLWIVLGPLGQSITAANNLGADAHLAAPPDLASAFSAAGVVFGVPVLGFALLWGALVVALTIRAARAHLPFTLTWWSFTFPVGTCVTGSAALAVHTGSQALAALSAVLFVGLLVAWVTVAARTLHGVFRTGRLLLPPA